MARKTLDPAARRRMLLASAIAICCLLSLAFIATANARREHSKTPTAPGASAETSAPAATGETGTAEAPAEAGATGTSSQAGAGLADGGQADGGQSAGGQDHGGHAGGGQSGSGGQNHGQTSAPSGTASPRHDHHSNGSSGNGSSSNGSSSHGAASTPSTSTSSGAAVKPASAGQDSASTPDAATTEATADAQAKHKKETKPKRKEPGKKGKGKSGKGSGGSSEGESESGSTSGSEESAGTSAPSTPTPITPTLAATPAVAAEPVAAEAATPALLTPAPVAATGLATSAAGSHSSRVARHAKAARGRVAAAPRRGVGALSPASPLPVAATYAVPSQKAAARGARTVKDGSARAAKRHSQASPLVTTITKIVGVVPVAVRMLIAALLGLALLLAVRSRVAALRARRLERQRVQLLEDVGLLQAALLPEVPVRLGPVGTTAAYQPAAGPGAGGDFYDVFALADGQLGVIVGDVSGHGREALPHTALLRYTLRAYLEAGLSPRDAVQTAGAVLEHQLGGVFATVVLATYQPRERVLVYSCAGHPPPLVLGGASPAIEPVTACASPPIGVGMRTGTRQSVLSIPGQAQICFYTDGVTEARIGSELFGRERLIDALAELGPLASASAVLGRVAELADRRPDDMAACLLSVEGDERLPVVLVDELELELDRDEALSARTERFLLGCGVERHEVGEMMRAASTAAEQARTVLLEVRHTDGPPEVTLQHEQIAYLHARRADMEVAL